MARSLFRDTIVLRGPAGLIPLAGAQVWFYEPNGGTPGPPISYPLYPDAHSAVTLPTPYVTGALGELEVWADLPHRAQIVAIKSGYAQVTETIDLEYPPELSATTDDIADAIRIHESEEDPHDQYLTQDEADLAYLKLTGGTVTGNVYVQGTLNSALDLNTLSYLTVGTVAFVAGKQIVASPDAGNALVWNTNGFYAPDLTTNLPALDNRYEQLSRKGAASGYVPLGADTKIPNAYLPDLAITNTFVVTSEAEMLALNAQTGDVCVRLDTTENYILAAEPATVLANWTKLAASTTAGNTTIVKREEFAPAAAATSVALTAVPTQMLSVSRNGVEQSQPAGHYTVSGVTVTFTDAFVAGERVSVVYEVGSSAPAPVNGYTKLESDARYLPFTGGVMTGAITWQSVGGFTPDTGNGYLAVNTYLVPDYTEYQDLGTSALRWRRLWFRDADLSGSITLTASSASSYIHRHKVTGDTQNRFMISADGTLSWGPGLTTFADTTLARSAANDLRTNASLSPTTTNARDLGTTALRWRKLWATDAEFTNAPTVGGVALPTSAGIDATYVPLAGGNVLTGSLGPSTTGTRDLGSAANMWRALYLSGSVNFNNGGFIAAAQSAVTNVGVLRMRNTHLIGWKNAANTTDLTLSVDASDRYAFSGSNLLLGGDVTLQRTGAGALRVDTDLGLGATVTPNGSPTYHPIIQFPQGAAIRGATTFSQITLATNSFVDSADVNKAVATGPAAYAQVTQLGDIRLATAPSVAAGATQTFANRFVLDNNGAITLSPAASQYAIQVANTGWGIRLNTLDPRQLEFAASGYTDHTMRNYQGDLWFYPNSLDPTRAMVFGKDGSLVLHPANGISGLINYGPARVGGYNAFEGSSVFQVNMASGMEELSSNYVRYGITCNPQMNVVSGATSVTAAALQVGIGGNNRPGGSHMQNAYGAMIAGPTISNSGTIAYAAALYLTNSVLGGAVSNQACIWHANTNAQLSNAGSWVNAASWAEGKSNIRYVEGDAVAAIATWFTQGWKPARYRYPAYTEPEIAKASASFGEAPGTKDALTPRPAMQDNEYDHFFAILDDMPQEVRDIICVSDTGAISTKDMDGFLAALLQHAMQRIVALEAKLEGKPV